MRKKYLRFEQMEVFRPMPTKTPEQQERFVDHIQPMPVPAASGVLEIGALVAQ